MRDYTEKNPRFSDTIRITDVSDPGNAQLLNAAPIQLLQNTLINHELIKKLEEKTGAAAEYESESVYKSGDYCLHNGTLYKCVQDTEGEWNAESWKSTNTLEEIGAVQKKLDEVFQSSNEKKQRLVSNLIAMGMQADTSETLEELIDKVLEMTNTSEDTVTEAVLLEGYTAHDAAGEQITGTIPRRTGVTVEATNVTQDSDYTYFEMPAGHYDENSKVRTANSNLTQQYQRAVITSAGTHSLSFTPCFVAAWVNGGTNGKPNFMVKSTDDTVPTMSATYNYVDYVDRWVTISGKSVTITGCDRAIVFGN
ncbi:MAG: hypothetical protein K2G55_00050 [Lachnospiraceae bacterium]|nr:hypothetical protein [Lachnospiraceae bacterium]MDE7205252.1 hypothetical protein [Lachnospiraceae bacterium]